MNISPLVCSKKDQGKVISRPRFVVWPNQDTHTCFIPPSYHAAYCSGGRHVWMAKHKRRHKRDSRVRWNMNVENTAMNPWMNIHWRRHTRGRVDWKHGSQTWAWKWTKRSSIWTLNYKKKKTVHSHKRTCCSKHLQVFLNFEMKIFLWMHVWGEGSYTAVNSTWSERKFVCLCPKTQTHIHSLEHSYM